MLRQYSKAISHLVQPGASPKDRHLSAVALLTCVVFICLELLRGRYRTVKPISKMVEAPAKRWKSVALLYRTIMDNPQTNQ